MTVPAAVLALLQQQSMIGADKPTHEVWVEGMPGVAIDDFNHLVWYRPNASNTQSNSYAQCNNGKIIHLWSTDTKLVQGYADNLASFLAGDSSVSDTVDIFEDAATVTYPRGSLFNDIDGDLYLAFTCNKGTDNIWKNLIYKSTSGNGVDSLGAADWVLHGTIQTLTRSNNSVRNDTFLSPIGKPVFLPSGRWVMSAVNYFAGSIYTYGWMSIFTSDDNGVNWTYRFTRGTGLIERGYNSSRILGWFDNKLWCVFAVAVLGIREGTFYSSPDGVTWTEEYVFPYGGGSDGAAYGHNFFTLGDYLYYMQTEGDNLWDTTISARCKIFRTQNPLDSLSWEEVFNASAGDFVSSPVYSYVEQFSSTLVLNFGQKIASEDIEPVNISAKSISISRNKGQASGLTITFDNKDGRYSPDKAEFNKVLWPGNQIEIKQGYGTNLTETFTGLIDKVGMASFPQEISVGARDMLKKALDQLITTGTGGHVIAYTDEPVEDIFTDLCTLAGITTGTVETTGINLTHTFSWETYADAFQLLTGIAYFTVRPDEYGVLHFEEFDTRQPEHTQSVTLDDDGGTQPWYTLEKTPGVLRSEQVYDSTETTLYIRDTDYEVEYSPMRIKRIDAAGIGDGDTVVVKYVYPAHIFQEGVDLIRTQMDISDEGLYAKAIAIGKGDDDVVIEAEEVFGSADFFGVNAQKILPIHLGRDGNTLAKCENVAERAIANITTKSRVISFAAVAVPWLKSGDRVQIVEVSMFGPDYTEPIFGDLLTGIGLVYTITDLSFSLVPNAGYTMTGEAFFSGYAPQPGV